MHTPSAPCRIASSLCLAALLVSCGGGDPDTVGSASSTRRERPLSVPPGTTIPADASTKGLFGPVQSWPLIAVHGVLTSDGRVLSYGTKSDGQQTGFFIYDVWDPTDGSHLTLPNNTQTDIFCGSQIMLPAGGTIVLNGGDNWTGTATTNTANNNSNVFDVATRTLARGNNMNRARWYSSSTMLLNLSLIHI